MPGKLLCWCGCDCARTNIYRAGGPYPEAMVTLEEAARRWKKGYAPYARVIREVKKTLPRKPPKTKERAPDSYLKAVQERVLPIAQALMAEKRRRREGRHRRSAT